jgi:hypothetical protein
MHLRLTVDVDMLPGLVLDAMFQCANPLVMLCYAPNLTDPPPPFAFPFFHHQSSITTTFGQRRITEGGAGAHGYDAELRGGGHGARAGHLRAAAGAVIDG